MPPLAALVRLWPTLDLPGDTWARFMGWRALGPGTYLLHGRSRSRMVTGARSGRCGERRSPHRISPRGVIRGVRVCSGPAHGPT